MPQPRLGCALLVEQGVGEARKLLLGQSGKEDIKGLWIIPGGGIEDDETPQQAGVRELQQEANLVVEVGLHAYTGEIKALDGTVKRRIEFFHATAVGGNLQPGDDLDDVDYFTAAQIAQMAAGQQITPFMHEVLKATGWL